MTVQEIEKRTRRFLKKSPLRDKGARKNLVKFPKWKEEEAQRMGIETLIILYNTYMGQLHEMGILEAYTEAIRTYSERWIAWVKDTEKGDEKDESEDDFQNND